MSKTVLVTGATGNQGGATARHLLARGWTVRALVRDAGKPAAKALRDRGAMLVEGDLDDPESLREPVAGAHGVFSVQALAHEPETLAAEVRRGKAIADAAKEATSPILSTVRWAGRGATRHRPFREQGGDRAAHPGHRFTGDNCAAGVLHEQSALFRGTAGVG